MDTEEGVEVVWNEATFSEAKKFKAQEDKLRSVFKRLTLIDHPNMVKFHKYWTDEGKPDDKNKLRSVFKRLTLIDHPNIVKFHKYWTDEGKPDDKNKENVKPRVVLITEYMSS